MPSIFISLQNKHSLVFQEIMEKRKARYLCHLDERILKENIQKQANYERILKENNIDTKNSNINLKVANKIIERTSIQNRKIASQKERVVDIVKKILREQKRIEQINAAKNKTYFGAIKRIKKTEAIQIDEEEIFVVILFVKM